MISCKRGDYEIIIRNNYVSNSEASGIFFMMFKKNIFRSFNWCFNKINDYKESQEADSITRSLIKRKEERLLHNINFSEGLGRS